MSMWSCINGSLEVDVPFAARSPESVKGYLEWLIKDLKRNELSINGSEGDAVLTVCPMPTPTGGTAYIDAFSKATINFAGHLRDRDKDWTSFQIEQWLDGFIHYADIERICISVTGDGDAEPRIFSDASCYSRDHLSSKADKERTGEQIQHVGFYFEEAVLTKEKCLEIAEIFKFADPTALLAMVGAMDMERFFSIKMAASHKSFLKRYGIQPPSVDNKKVHEFLKERGC